MNEVIGIIIAAILCWLNFVIVDTYFGLPEQPGVRGARIIGENVEKRGVRTHKRKILDCKFCSFPVRCRKQEGIL